MRQSGAGTPEAGLAEYVGTQAETAEAVAGAELCVTHLAPIGEAVLDANPQLGFIGVARGGPVNIDVDAVTRRGICLVNAPGRNKTAVAEYTIGLMLAATRRIAAGYHALANGRWRGDLYRSDTAGPELRELTVGLIGWGRIGSLLPAMLAPFGPRVLVHDPYVKVPDTALAKAVDFDTLIADADIVSLHARCNAANRHMIGQRALAAMRNHAYLINTARGDLVDHAALYSALMAGEIAGCALDTFDAEPLPSDSPLLELEQVVATPHIAGASQYTINRAAAIMADEVGCFLRGDPPHHPVG